MWDQSNVMEESKHLTNSSWNSAAEKSLKASDYEEWLDPKFTEQEIPSRKAPPVPQVCPPCTSSCLPAICWFVRYSHTRLLSSLPCGQNVAGVSVTWCENISWINNSPEAEQKIRKKQAQHEPTKKSKHIQTHIHTCGHAAFTALRMLNYYIQVCGFMCNSIEIHTNAHTAEFQFSCLSSTIKNMESTSVMSSTSLDLLRRLYAAKRTIFLQIFVCVYKCHTCVASGVTFFFLWSVQGWALLQTLLKITSERVRLRWFKAGLHVFLSCISLHILFVRLFFHDLFINKQSEDHFSNCSPWIYRHRLLCACTRDYTIKSQVLAGNYTLYMFTCEAIIRWCGSECTPRVSRTKDKAGGWCINHLRVLVFCQKRVFSTNARLQHLYNCAPAS